MELGYAPYDPTLDAPGDRRRFVSWATDRGVDFAVTERPQPGIDVAVVSSVADLVRWRDAPSATRVVYDLTDDYLGLPATGLKNRARGVAKFLSGELSRPTLRYRELMADMCRRADVVVCTSSLQREHVEATGARDVRIILDCYEADTLDLKTTYRLAGAPRLVWEGLPFNVGTLELLREPLRSVPPGSRPWVHVVTPPTFRPYARRFGRRSTIDVAHGALPDEQVVVHPWMRDSYAQAVADCDLAVIPLPLDDRFAFAKSAQKLISLWAIGMPVITSATPAYEEAMRGAGLDLACRTTADWTRALTRLLGDEDERRHAAQAGRAFVEAHASREIMLARWDDVMA